MASGEAPGPATSELRVVVNAQLPPGGLRGGVEQFAIGLVAALGRLEGPERYTVVGPWDDPDWLRPYLGENQRLVRGQAPLGRGRREILRAELKARSLLAPRFPARGIEPSRGFFERFDPHVVHFPYQAFRRCRVHTVFNPHDFQHLHHPQFFEPAQLAYRRRFYRGACAVADAVACESRQTAADAVDGCGADPSKVFVVHRGAPTDLYAGPREAETEAARRLAGEEQYALYPAQAWPHKNHRALVRALQLLRERHGRELTVVCTGRRTTLVDEVETEARRLGVGDRLRFVGFVSPGELRALYRGAHMVVFPSLFEGGGFPVVEAFAEGTPVACSDLPALAEYAGGAALLFDPRDEASIAGAMARLVDDEPLRAELVRKGRRRAASVSWRDAAVVYRALYRKLAGRPLAAEDRAALERSAYARSTAEARAPGPVQEQARASEAGR